MGLVTSRLNLDSLNVGGLRSQQDEVCFSYSLSKNYFSNYFLMGGERYEVSDPDYLFGDNCDLNFLGCNKPSSIPYKKAQQYLLANLKQNKSCNKVSSRVSRLSMLASQDQRQTQDLRKQDVQQTQTLTTRGSSAIPEPSKPLVMLINIRKETIRLVKSPLRYEHEVSSLVSASSSTRSGYTSVKGEEIQPSSDIEDDEDDFKDALNDGGDDSDSVKAQQHESLLPSDIRITIENPAADFDGPSNSTRLGASDLKSIGTPEKNRFPGTDYNIEFTFDTEVDCSMRVFYFCTRETTSTGITYKPLHATYKSEVYYYKRGLNQKFDQPEHTFQPYLFDEDLLIYKPLDTDGNYNSGSVFPIVIQCVALEGPMPRQSHSLVATIEKSQLDGSFSIKPLKQIIFADGMQFILQDIYGIEHKQLLSDRSSSSRGLNRGSTSSIQQRSSGTENTFECVICISEERDTMLLPCRHLCLCKSCAQSLRYQANSCPICRSPFKAALNIRPSTHLQDKDSK